MHLELKHPHLSIKKINAFSLPEFSVLIGRNGVGKTQILDGIATGNISVPGIETPEIEKFDISSFQIKDSGSAGWGNAYFALVTADHYFSTAGSPSPFEIAKQVFTKLMEELIEEGKVDQSHQKEHQFREQLYSIPDFSGLENIKKDSPAFGYFRSIKENVLNKLRSKSQNRGSSTNFPKNSLRNDPAILLTMAMKINQKLPHELNREDILRAANYEGELVENKISQLFARYKFEQYVWAHTQSEETRKSVETLMEEYRKAMRPPWEVLRKTLNQLRESSSEPSLFNFEFSDPEYDRLEFSNYQQYTFQTEFTNRSTGDSYSIQHLSSGEKILLCLTLAMFNKYIGRRQPRLVLLDEIDALLHPSMISALIAGLKNLFVNNGTRVIMATHSVTTVSMLDEGETYGVSRIGNAVSVQPVSRSEAVSQLSEGLATIDTGLKIIATETATPITILTEGYNTLHLKKWVSLFFPGKIHVFEGLEDGKSNDKQLLQYGRIISRMNTNTQFLIVWDCDAEEQAKILSRELSEGSVVSVFSFTRRKNRITSKGIENKYDEEILQKYSKRTVDESDGTVVAREFNGRRKTEFAQYIFAEGSRDHFMFFDDLGTAVQQILDRLENE